jgi:hypothetical protein
MSKLQWEFGDCVIWVSLGKGKPIPVNIYMKQGVIGYEIQTTNKISEYYYNEIDKCVKERIAELQRTWNGNMTRRLKWPDRPPKDQDRL